jgi:hypothetical protein
MVLAILSDRSARRDIHGRASLGHMDVSQVACRIIGFGLLHPADRLRKCLELIRRGRQFGMVLGVSAETPAEDRTGIDVLCAARVHVAAKEKDAGDPRARVQEQRDKLAALAKTLGLKAAQQRCVQVATMRALFSRRTGGLRADEVIE